MLNEVELRGDFVTLSWLNYDACKKTRFDLESPWLARTIIQIESTAVSVVVYKRQLREFLS